MTTTAAKLLVIEEDENERDVLLRLLSDKELQVVAASSSQQAAEYLNEPIDLVISDSKLVNGTTDLLICWKRRQPDTRFILVSASGDRRAAVEAMKRGAEDCLHKPVDPEELLLVVERCIESRRKDAHIAELTRRLDEILHVADRPAPLDNGGAAPSPESVSTGAMLKDLERAAVKQALQLHRGNRTHAASALGISVRTLQRKLKAWGVGNGERNGD